jgi:hypothetical protein
MKLRILEQNLQNIEIKKRKLSGRDFISGINIAMV